MLCEWRLSENGADSNPYHEYRNFPTVFCLKINHDGAFKKPFKIRYKGGKVNWIDTIDFDKFSINDVSDMMKNIGYDNVAMEYYFKKPNTELDKGLRKLATNSDVLEMLKFVPKYKVLDDVSEDEWLQESLRKLHRFSQSCGQSSNNVDNVVQARRNRNVYNLVITKDVSNEGNAVSEHES
nr:transposase, MuDR [Tanacetum cinerariifolium]